MKKILILGAFVVVTVLAYTHGVTAAAYAKNVLFGVQSERGQEVLHPGAMAKSFYRFASVTEDDICAGKCMVFDVLLTSGVSSSYAVLYDSAAATAGTTVIVSALHFNGTTPVSLAAGNPNAFPIVTTRGLGIDLSSVSAGEEALILYKDLD